MMPLESLRLKPHHICWRGLWAGCLGTAIGHRVLRDRRFAAGTVRGAGTGPAAGRGDPVPAHHAAVP